MQVGTDEVQHRQTGVECGPPELVGGLEAVFAGHVDVRGEGGDVLVVEGGPVSG